MMPRVYLSLGSNIDRRRHIQLGLDALFSQFGDILCSPVYESAAVGFVGERFYNLVVGIDTDLSVGELSLGLKRIEDEQGRDRNAPKFSSRTLDIDILTYGGMAGVIDGVALPRDEILLNAFVLLPLSKIASGVIHPVVNKTYAQLWDEFDKTRQELWEVAFDWKGNTRAKNSDRT